MHATFKNNTCSLTSKEKCICSLGDSLHQKKKYTDSCFHYYQGVIYITQCILKLRTALFACLVVFSLCISVLSARRYPHFPAAATGAMHRITSLSDTSRRWIETCTSKMSVCRWMPKCGGRSTTDTTLQRRFNQSSYVG